MFTNKIILITGGSSGIGAATALAFAAKGADVVITYKSNKAGAGKVVAEVEKLGRKCLAIKVDLINDKKAKKVIDLAVKKFGKIDVLVNNAGRYIDGDEWNGKTKVWIKSLEQNLLSMMNVSRYAVELFQKQQKGIMINIASRHGMSGCSDALSYSAAKAGVINITQIYAKILSEFGGRANSVSPWAANAGYWLTAPKEEVEMTVKEAPGGHLVEPETIAEKIIYLASDEAKDINGQNFPVKE
jgi:NAD(P)-dependent dehydrogenase (short-subunit alcohol dehydrogenase family)